MNVHQIQYHNYYMYIDQDQHFSLTSQLQISNYLMQNLCLNLLTMYLIYMKYVNLLHFQEEKIHYLASGREPRTT